MKVPGLDGAIDSASNALKWSYVRPEQTQEKDLSGVYFVGNFRWQ